MSLIRKSTELNIPTNVKMMIYGQAGMGSEGRTFFQDLAVMDWSSIQYAFLGGVVWNFSHHLPASIRQQSVKQSARFR